MVVTDKKIDTKQMESFTRFSSEIRNKALADAYIAVRDLISQKEFAKRVKVSESRFSRILAKVETSTK